MKIVAIVQARTGSTRLPNKVMKSIEGVPVIEILLSRLHRSKKVNQIVVATTNLARDDGLASYVFELGFDVFRGDELNVFARFLGAARHYSADIIVRITGDCPLVDPNLVDEVVSVFLSENNDYVSNIDPPTYPDGLDVEVFSRSALERASQVELSEYAKEHVTPIFRESQQFRTSCHRNDTDQSMFRVTLDEHHDYIFLESAFSYFSPNLFFDWRDLLSIMHKDERILCVNQEIVRNAGSQNE